MDYIVGYASKLWPILKWSVIIYHSYAVQNLNSYQKDSALNNKILVQDTPHIVK